MRTQSKINLSDVPGRRLKRRLIVHHVPLCAISAGSVLLLYVTRPYRDVWMKASFATAYPSLFLLIVTLLIGPFNVLTKRRNPISGDLRRDTGIWAAILAILHSLVGQNVHLRGRPWLYYVYGDRQRHLVPMRHDLFGFANYTGLLGTLIVIILLASSNDYSLRKLGTPQWKSLQRWNYAIFGLVAAHAIAYQTIEHQRFPFVVVAAIGILTTLAFQATGYYRRRFGRMKVVIAERLANNTDR